MTNTKQFLKNILSCKECKPDFDGKGGWQFCKKHWKELKQFGEVNID